MSYTEEEKRLLHEIALRSITEGIATRKHWTPNLAALPAALKEKRATFVTLHSRGDLRGCVGSVQATQPLAEDVAENAYRAAFRDSRFSPLSHPELADLEISISILSPFEPLAVSSREDLLGQLVPGRDGLYLDSEDGRATFLPDVWKTIVQPARFVDTLMRKAGLPGSYPFSKIQWSVYRTEKI